MSNYGEWSLTQLKDELRRRKAKVYGKKKDLVQRLIDYDITFNRQDNLIPIRDEKFEMDLPDLSLYRDINSDTLLPAISDDCLNRYIQRCEKRNSDMGKKMYNDRYLLCVRFASLGLDGASFIKSRVASAYKSNIVYNVDVKVQDSLIDECQCECAAGMGPSAHCKHVCTVLCALTDFTKTKTIKTQYTCTSKLQTFHKVKKFKGSPVKAAHLNISEKSNHESFEQFDPRPSNLRSSEAYPSYFRNLSINFAASFPTSDPFPILQLYSAANLRSFYNDHDYCQSPEKSFLFSHKLIDLSTPEATEIEQSTRGQTSNALWIKYRSMRLPSSMFKTICHLTKRTNLPHLLETMTNWSEIYSKPTEHGKKYESVAVKQFQDRYGVETSPCGLFISSKHPFICASPDRMINEEEILEVKCPFSSKECVISTETVDYLYLCEVSGEFLLRKEHRYFYQIQGRLFCSGRNVCRLVVYTFKDLKVIPVYRDDIFIHEMVKKLSHFYETYFKSFVISKFLYNWF